MYMKYVRGTLKQNMSVAGGKKKDFLTKNRKRKSSKLCNIGGKNDNSANESDDGSTFIYSRPERPGKMMDNAYKNYNRNNQRQRYTRSRSPVRSKSRSTSTASYASCDARSRSRSPVRETYRGSPTSPSFNRSRSFSRERSSSLRRRYSRSPSPKSQRSRCSSNSYDHKRSRKRHRSGSFHTSSSSNGRSANRWSTEDGNVNEDQQEEEDMPVPGRLFVGSLNQKACKLDVMKVFEPYGSCTVYIGHNPGGYAFVQYQNPEDAVKAIKELNGTEQINTTIRVKPCQPRIGGRIPYGQPGYVRGRTHNWIGLDGTKKSRAEQLARGEWPFVTPRGGRGRGHFGERGRGSRGGSRGQGRFTHQRGRGRGYSYNTKTDTGEYDSDDWSQNTDTSFRKKPKFNQVASDSQGDNAQGFSARLLRQKRGHDFSKNWANEGFKTKERRFQSRSPIRNRTFLLDTPKPALLDTPRPVLLETPSEPVLITDSPTKSPTTHSYKGNRPPKTKKSKSSIYKKYKGGTKYNDFRYEQEQHFNDDYNAPSEGSVWGQSAPSSKASEQQGAHFSDYQWPTNTSQDQVAYGQEHQQALTYYQHQGAVSHLTSAVGTGYTQPSNYDQSSYSQAPNQQSQWPQQASSNAYYQDSYSQSTAASYSQTVAGYGQTAAVTNYSQSATAASYDYSAYPAATTVQYTPADQASTHAYPSGIGIAPSPAGTGYPTYSVGDQLAIQLPILESTVVSSKGKSKKKGEAGYERLAAAYERLASVLEKAFKEDAPVPPMPPRSATPGRRSPSRRSSGHKSPGRRSPSLVSPGRRSPSPMRPSTPTRDEESQHRRTVIYPSREYQLF